MGHIGPYADFTFTFTLILFYGREPRCLHVLGIFKENKTKLKAFARVKNRALVSCSIADIA